MPFVLPPGVAIGSQEAIYLKSLYDSGQASSGSAQTALVPLGYQQVTNDQLAAVQTLTVPSGAMIADIQNNGSQPCRWRDDAGDPTSTMGRIIAPDDTLRYMGNLSALKMVRAADGVTLDISFYR